MEVGLSTADDPDILAWAATEDRIVVTRTYQDFAPLVEAWRAGYERRYTNQ